MSTMSDLSDPIVQSDLLGMVAYTLAGRWAAGDDVALGGPCEVW